MKSALTWRLGRGNEETFSFHLLRAARTKAVQHRCHATHTLTLYDKKEKEMNGKYKTKKNHLDINALLTISQRQC